MAGNQFHGTLLFQIGNRLFQLSIAAKDMQTANDTQHFFLAAYRFCMLNNVANTAVRASRNHIKPLRGLVCQGCIIQQPVVFPDTLIEIARSGGLILKGVDSGDLTQIPDILAEFPGLIGEIQPTQTGKLLCRDT